MYRLYFLIGDDGLLEKYKTIWDKASTDIKKVDSGPVYDEEFLKTKINLMMMKLQILTIKKFHLWILIILF